LGQLFGLHMLQLPWQQCFENVKTFSYNLRFEVLMVEECWMLQVYSRNK
jgi:hypothetical protein